MELHYQMFFLLFAYIVVVSEALPLLMLNIVIMIGKEESLHLVVLVVVMVLGGDNRPE
jgi:hypothetical protein